MFGFGAISELPISTTPTVADGATTHTGSATLNAIGSVASVGVQQISAASTLSASGTTLNAGVVHIVAASLLVDSGTVAASGVINVA